MSDGRLTTGASDAELEARLGAELAAWNFARSGVDDQRELTVRVEDAAGELMAGLSGWTWGTCAGIGMVWVREDCRSAGWGGRLLAAAEAAAVDRGCTRIFVTSFSFQAPAFYERHGYRECARVAEYPLDGAAEIYLMKSLSVSGLDRGPRTEWEASVQESLASTGGALTAEERAWADSLLHGDSKPH